jgi:NADH-quinone oxidoreductase subunit M
VVPALLGVVISAVYGLRAVARVFYGPPTEAFLQHQAAHPVTDLRWVERVPVLVLLITLIALGVWPKAISTPVNSALEALYPAVEAVTPQAAANLTSSR